MAAKRKLESNVPTLEEVPITQAERDDAKLKQIYEIPIEEIDPFPDHPFKVKDDEEMTELIPELLELVDQKQIALRPAVELSYLTKESQQHLMYCIDMLQCTPSHAQAIKLRKMDAEGALDMSIIEIILSELKPNQKERVAIKSEKIIKMFPANLPVDKREDYIIAAMKHYEEHMKKHEKSDLKQR